MRIKFLRKVSELLDGDSGFAELLKGSSVSFFMKGIGLIIAQLFTLIVARLLGADAYGIFSLSLALLTIFSILSMLGLDTGILRFTSSNKEKDYRITSIYFSSISIVVPMSVLLTLLGYFGGDFIAVNFFDKPQLASYFKLISLGIIPFTFTKLNSQCLRGFKEAGKYTFLSFISRYLFAILFLLPIFYFFIEDDRAVIISFVLGLYVISIISFYWVVQLIDFSVINLQKKIYKSLLKVSLPLMFASSLQFIKGWIDTLMLGNFMTSGDVGIYNVSLKLAGLVGIVLTAVNIIAAPQIAEAYGRGVSKQDLNKVIQKASRLIFWGALPVFLGILLFSNLLLLIFGERFVAGQSALIILGVGYLVNSVSGSVGYVMQMTNKQVAFQNITFLTAIIGIVLNYYLIPLFGINGAAISTTVGIVFWNISSVLYLRMRYNLITYYNPFIKNYEDK